MRVLSLLLLVLAAVASNAFTADTAPPVPDLPDCFEADVTITMPILGSIKGHLFYEEQANMSRVDQTIWGSAVKTIQDGNNCLQYSITSFFGQNYCNTSFLTDPMAPMTLPPAPFSNYVGDEVINGVMCQHWRAGVLFSMEWYVDVSQPIPALVRFVMLVGPVKMQEDFENVVAHDTFPKSVFAVDTPCSNPVCEATLDIVLVLDGSLSIVPDDFLTMQQFGIDLVNYFSIGEATVEMSVVQFASTVSVVTPLTSSKDDLISGLKTMTQIATGTNTYSGLQEAQNQLTNGRSDTTKVIILITDGESNQGGDPVGYAQSLQNEGDIIFAVGVGAGADFTQIDGIASKPIDSHVFAPGSFTDLAAIVEEIAASSCMSAVGGCGSASLN